MTLDDSLAPEGELSLLRAPGGGANASFSLEATKRSLKSFTSHLRKRKRRGGSEARDAILEDEAVESSDRISVASWDVSEAPEVKRSKTMARVTSLASVMTTPVARVGQALSRSISGARLPYSPSPRARPPGGGTPTKFLGRSVSTLHMPGPTPSTLMRAPESPYGTLRRGAPGRNSATNITPYKPPPPTTNKQRPTRYWSSEYPESGAQLMKQEIKLQEAIHEINCGEEDLVDDLHLVQKTYAESLLQLNVLTASEVEMVFGNIRKLLPLHVDLHRSLTATQSPASGLYCHVGQALLKWTSTIRQPYVDYCSSLIKVKTFLDLRRESDKDFRDFLQRCLESPFSRKLDLWAYLDVPRSRLVKYPLLFKQVLKFTESPSDLALLTSTVHQLETILQDVDTAMAQARCQNTIARLDWLDDCPADAKLAVINASEAVLEGVLRNNRGTKMECHLMDTVLILGRPSTRGQGGVKRLQVYRTPIPIEELVLEDLDAQGSVMGSGNSTGSGSSGSKSGSFKSAFSTSQAAKSSSFRVSFRRVSLQNLDASSLDRHVTDAERKQLSHTLIATDEHSKRQWMTSLQKTIDQHMAKRQQERGVDLKPASPNNAGGIPMKLKSGPRAGLFQKNGKRSPRIKASLSSTHVDSLKRGAAIKRFRHNASTSALRSENMPVFDENTPILHYQSVPRILTTSGGPRLRSGTVGSAKPPLPGLHGTTGTKRGSTGKLASPLRERQLKSATNTGLKMSGRTKSCSHLVARSDEHLTRLDLSGQVDMPRYLTRSTLKKISKSMSDLLEL